MKLWIDHPGEQKKIRMIVRLRDEGKSRSMIAMELNVLGWKPRTGKWEHTKIGRILRRVDKG